MNEVLAAAPTSVLPSAPGVQLLLLVAVLTIGVPFLAWALARAWDRPMVLVATMIVALAVPWRTGGEDAALLHLTVADLVAAVLAAVVLARLAARPTPIDEERLASWVLLPLLGLVAAATFATFTAADATASLSGAIRQAQLLVVVPLAAMLSLRDRLDLRLLLGSVLVLGVSQSAIGVMQFATETGASYGGEDIRAVGTFGAYAIMALPAVLTTALIVATALALVYRGARRTSALAAIAVLVPGLAASFSRGFWVAALVGVVVVLAVWDWRRAALLATVAGVAGGLLLAAGTAGPDDNPLLERAAATFDVLGEPDQSVQDRYALWTAAVRMWEDHPATGVGLKNYPRYRDSYVSFDFSGRSDVADPQGGFRQVALLSPHNNYLLVLAEQGLVGIVAYLAFILTLGVAVTRRVLADLRAGADPLERSLGLAVVGLLAAYLVGALSGDAGGAVGLLDAVLLFGGALWLASGARLADVETLRDQAYARFEQGAGL